MNEPKVSVVIKTYDDREDSKRGFDFKQPEGLLISYLHQTLEVMSSQTLQPYEIIIVDSSKGDGIKNVIGGDRQYIDSLPVYRVPLESKDFSHPKALNLGIRKASGDLVSSLSGDATPANDRWLEYLVQPFSDQNVAGTFCRQISRPDVKQPIMERVRLWWRYRNEEDYERKEPVFSNAGCVFRRDLALEIPFDENLVELEDYDWAIKVRNRNLRIIYVGKSEIYHSHLSSNLQILKRMVYYAYLRYRFQVTNWIHTRFSKSN